MGSTGDVRPGVLLFLFMSLSWVLSIFCNNIAVALMITPFAIGIANATEERMHNERSDASMTSQDLETQTSSTESSADEPGVAECQKLSTALLLGIAYGTT